MTFNMTGNIALLSLLALSTTEVAAVHELENPEMVKAAFIKHSTRESTVEIPSVFLTVLINDINQFGLTRMGSFSATDTAILLQVSGMDLLALQQRALTPYMEKICDALASRVVDLTEIASLYSLALEDEVQVTRQVYLELLRSLSSDGSRLLSEYIQGIANNGHVMRVDWAGIAEEVPLYTHDFFTGMCAPAVSDQELQQIVEQILGR